MNNLHQTAITKEDKESKMKITTSNLIRWAGLSAMVAGIIFAGIQPIHPPDVLASVTTSAWAIITSLKTVMCFLFLLGIAGLYARQVEKTGWLGLAGYLLFSLFWALQCAFHLRRSLYLAAVGDRGAEVCGGLPGDRQWAPWRDEPRALPALYALAGILYMLGGLLFGIATFRAGILPRWAAGLLAVAAVLHPSGCAASAPDRAVSGSADGDSAGLAGLCALVGTARARSRNPYLAWEAPSSAKPQPSSRKL